MASRHRPAKQVAEPTEGNGFWIDHAQVTDDDLVWLEQVEELTLWNVKLPSGFLARLPRLWWLDIRGGTAVNLESLRGAAHLQYLAVNRVGGLRDLSEIALLTSLRLLSLYGLAQVSTLPSLRGLAALERAEIGQMRSIMSRQVV